MKERYMTTTSAWAPIFKSEEQDDGTIVVYGKATDDALDRDRQRCDANWLNKAMPEWYKTGANIREQHDGKRAVGVGIGHEIAPDGHYIRAHIVDPIAVLKVKHNVLKGFSIGIANPNVEKSESAPNGLINGGDICELSLCDRPSNPGCLLALAKSAEPGMSILAADFDEARGLVRVQELVEKDETPELTATVGDSLSPEQVEKLNELVSEKSDAPADVVPLDIATATGCGCCDKCGMPGCGCCDMCMPAGKSADGVAGAEGLQASVELAKNALGELGLLGPAGSDAEFDVDAAKALVAETVAKADSGLGQDESGDIDGASQAIAIIAQLIQSEAKDLADTPAQGCDIDLLMQAVHALRIFTCREAKEQAGIDPGAAPILLSEEPELEKADDEPYGDVEYADPGYQKDKKKRYPVDTAAHARAALAYISKPANASEYSSADLAKVKSRIEAACKKFGIDVSDKAIEPEVEKTIETEEAPVADIVETDAEKAVEPVIEKADAPEAVEAPAVIEKASTVEVDTEAVEKAVAEALAKAFSAEVLEKEDNPLRKAFNAIVEAQTESIAKATADAVARLEKVEQMAVPGGPALRRTEIERTESRKHDLERELARFKALANSEDRILRTGALTKAAQIEAEIKSL
jgi:hypothetical protein